MDRIVETKHRYISPKGMQESWNHWLDGHEEIALPFINSQLDFIATTRRPTPREKISVGELKDRSTVKGKIDDIHCGKSSGGGVVIKRTNGSNKGIFCNSYLRRSKNECANFNYPHWNVPSELIDKIKTPEQAHEFLSAKNIYGLVILADHTNSHGFKLIQPPNFRFVFFAYRDLNPSDLMPDKRNNKTDRWKVKWTGIPSPRTLTPNQFFNSLESIL